MRLIVTGATAGIGRALTLRLVSRGHQVWGVAKTAAPLEALAHQLGNKFFFTVADVSDPSAGGKLLAAMAAAGFAPEAVVLNAGIYPHDSDQDFDFAVAARVIATNLTGALALVAEILPGFLRQGYGQFVAVSSIFALRPDPLGVSYAASKAGLTLAFRSLAQRYRASPVRFKTVVLGPILTAGDALGRRPRLAWHLRRAEQAARAIAQTLDRGKTLTYYPRLVGWALRATAWLPDSVFTAMTQPVRR